jgi:FkbM family methyltransferase
MSYIALATDLRHEIQSFFAQSRISCDQSSDQFMVPGHRPLTATGRFARPGKYEETALLLLSFLIGRLRPKVFFDVGAASGDFARVAASHIASPPAVHAFEMQPLRVQGMCEALERDGLGGQVAVHLAGLSDHHEGKKDIWFARTHLYEREPAPHEWREAWWRRLKFAIRRQPRGLSKARVLITSIDHFVAEHAVVPELIKIDVDGYEGKVLQGGMRTFAEHRPAIMLELHKDELIRFGETRRDVVSRLFGVGYKAMFMTDHHVPKACRVVSVDLDHPLVARQETDFLLFC